MKKTGIFAPKTQFFPFKTQCTAGLRPELSCRKVYKKNLDSMNWIVTFSMPRGLTIDCNMSFNWRVFDLILVEMGNKVTCLEIKDRVFDQQFIKAGASFSHRR